MTCGRAYALIREKARRAMELLTEFKLYQVSRPTELKVEYIPVGFREIQPHDAGERINDRNYVFEGKDFLDARPIFENPWASYRKSSRLLRRIGRATLNATTVIWKS